ncbi:hypothetical protein E3P84_03445 [Wallemia ichthyophaga]|nr:hypothetical protein E3P84_03445 [Wallemia ichthyophaga]TIB39704.1 hypothetical protein E3P83_03345 [Wallemia ichthyophaga]
MSARPKTAKKDGSGSVSAGNGNSAADGIKKVVTRVSRACDQCRKQKMRCQNADDPPCVRCKSANIPCTFEKPARDSTAIGEAGLERIRSLEMQVSSMSSNLFELVGFFRSTNKAQPQSLDNSPFGSAQASASQPQLHHLAAPAEQFPLKRPVEDSTGMRHTPQGTHFLDSSQHHPHPVPGAFPSSHHSRPFHAFASPRNSKRQYFHSTVTSAASSDDEEELPSSALVAPIEVLRGLADAAAERHATEAIEAKEQALLRANASASDDQPQSKLPHHSFTQPSDSFLPSKRKDMADNPLSTGRNKRKKKCDPPHAYADVVTKGVVSDQTARELFKIYFEECHKFLPLFDPTHDTYEELRKRSPFCVTVICMVAARVMDGGNAPTQLYLDCQREAREIAKNSMFLQMTRKEAVQALLLFSAFQDNSWLVGGHAVRVAYEVGLDKAISKLLRRLKKTPSTNSPADDYERQIVAAHRLSFGTGRTAFLRDDRGTLSHSRILLDHPLATPTDFRLVSTVELLQIREKVHTELQPFDARVDEHTFATLRSATVEFDGWFNDWKEHIQNKFPDQQFFIQSLYVQRQYAELFHHAVALRGIKGPSDIVTMPMEQRSIAHRAMGAAQHCLDACIKPGEYGHNLKYAVHYTHVCAAFAGSFLLRLAKLFPEDLQLDSILERVEILAELLSRTPASRYGRSLRLMLNRSMRQATPSELGRGGSLPAGVGIRTGMSGSGGDIGGGSGGANLNGHNNGNSNTNNIPMSNGMMLDTGHMEQPWNLMEGTQQQQEGWSPVMLNGLGIETSTSTPNSQSTLVSGENGLGGGIGTELPLWLQETNLGDLGLTNTGTEAYFLPSEDLSSHRSSTLFVSNLPFTLTNESLLTAFSDVGPLKSAFVVLDHDTKESKGVGYVTYAMREDAVAASSEMNNKLIQQGSDKRKCRVEWARQRATLKERKEIAKENEMDAKLYNKPQATQPRKVVTSKDPDAVRTVVLSGLPKGISQKEIYKKVRKIGNIDSLDLKDDDIAHVKFDKPSSANTALSKLHAHIFKGKTISAVLLKRLETAISGKGKVSRRSRLIIRNLNFNITQEDLKATFIPYGDIHMITLPTIKAKDGSDHNKGYGFVWFTFHHDAQKAIEKMNGKSVKLATSEADVAAAGGTKKQRKRIAKDVESRPVAVDWALSKEKWEHEQNDQDNNEDVKMDQDANKSAGSDEESNNDNADDNDSKDNSESESEGESEDEQSSQDDQDSQDNDNVDDDEIMEEIENESATDDSEEEDGDKAPPLQDGLTLFVRNIPFEATQQDLYEVFRRFGKLRYARITMDYETERSRGNGFVAFWDMKAANECLKTADVVRATTGTNRTDSMKQNPFQTSSILTADPTSKSAHSLTLQGRVLDVVKAVSRDEAVEKKEEGEKVKHKKDKRNVYLIREGVIFPNSPAGQALPEADQERRMKSFNTRRKLLESNPSLYISKTRLSIRQIPLYVTDKVLKRLALHAVKEFEAEVARGERDALSREELEDTTESDGSKDPKKAFKGRPTAVIQSKIVRQTDRVDTSTGLGKSRGYGFLEMNNHKNALRVLRYANNNSEVTNMMKAWLVDELEQAEKRCKEAITTAKGEKKDEERTKLKKLEDRLTKAKNDQLKDSRGTLMIEFSIENAQVIKRRSDKAEVMRNRALKRKAAEMDEEVSGEEEEQEQEEQDKPQKKQKKGVNKDGKKDNKQEKKTQSENDNGKSDVGSVIGQPFDAAPLAGSSPAHRGHVIVHTQIPPREWPSKVNGLSEKYDDLVIKKELSDAGVLVGLAFNPSASDKNDCQVYPAMEAVDGHSTAQILSSINQSSQNDCVHIYVCTHGNRDCRCAEAGEPTVHSLRTEINARGLEDRVKLYEISHIGGHKWAANAIVFPQGDWYGNLRPWDSSKFLTNILAGAIHWPHWRGRLGYDPAKAVDAANARSLDLESSCGETKDAMDALNANESDIVPLRFRESDGAVHYVDALLGESLMNVGRREGLGNVEGVCDGKLECATCHMYFPSSDSAEAASFLPDVRDEEDDMLQYAVGYDDQKSRLGCQIKVTPELSHWCAKGGTIDLPKY